MNVKKIFVVLLFVFCNLQLMEAIPADPSPKLMKQADGSTITVVTRGDEHAHLSFTEDGYPLFFNSKTKNYEYASIENGHLVGSGIVAEDEGHRNSKAQNYVAQMDVNSMIHVVWEQGKTNRMRRVAGYKNLRINDFPTLGKQKTLVILIQFSDTKFSSVSDPKTFYIKMFNEPDFTYKNGADGSARDFYLKASDNQFDPTFVVVGPVTLSHSASYYGSDSPTQDAKMGEAVEEACQLADDSIDFSQYDTDEDGYVDNIAFIYAGYGQADTNVSNYIWPHAANLETEWGIKLTCDGKKIGHYFCSNEIRYSSTGDIEPAGIGTAVHEFGHILGLPDLYDVSYSLLNFGLYYWDTMAAGSYNNNGNTPPTFSSYERLALNWLTPEDLTTGADSICNLPNLAESNKAYRVPVPNRPNEFYMLENRQQTGWDSYVYGHGMLVWHIDEDSASWAANTVNTNASHQRVDIVEADGILSDATRSGDTYPGRFRITSCGFSSWAGANLLALDYIKEANDTISFAVAHTDMHLPAPSVQISNLQDSSFVLSWSPVVHADQYYVSLYRNEANGKVTTVGDYLNKTYSAADTIKIDSLAPDTRYDVIVRAGFGSYLSDSVSQSVQTLELPFYERKPMGLGVSDVVSTGFKAYWGTVKDADAYTVSLYQLAYGDSDSVQGYDFGQRLSGLPELWKTSSNTFYSVNGYYGKSAPAIKFAQDSDSLLIAFPETKIKKLSFWYRGKNASGKIHIEEFVDGGWSESAVIDSISDEGTTVSESIDDASEVCIRWECESGFIVLDDVMTIGNSLVRFPVTGYTGIVSEDSTYTFSGLAEGETYSFKVNAVSNGQDSYDSDEYEVTLPSVTGIQTITLGEESPALYYDITGKRVQKGTLHPGIYIVRKGADTYKVVVK